MTKEIVIIGASFAGLTVVQKLNAKLQSGYKITVVEPSKDFVWTVGLPRGIVQSGYGSKLFFPLSKAFAKYSTTTTHIQDRVESVDPTSKSVRLQNGTSLNYDILVLASGASAASPWKVVPSEQAPGERLKAYLKEAAQAIKDAHTIVVGGAGPIGIETVAEIKESYPKKRVVLINANERLLAVGDWPASAANKLQRGLEDAGVEIISSTRVVSPTATTLNPTTVQLSTGSSIADAVYISAIGFRSNSSFLPSNFVAANGDVLVKPSLQTEADSNIWALGDVIKSTRKFSHVAETQADLLAANLVAVIQDQTPSKTWQAGAVLGMIQLGTFGGSGAFGWLTFPAFLVKWVKGKDLLLSKAAGFGFEV